MSAEAPEQLPTLSPPTAPLATDWSALLLGLLLLLSAAILILSAPILAVMGLAAMTSSASVGEPLSLLMLAASALVLGMLMVPGIYLNARKFFNAPEPDFRLPAIPPAATLTTLFLIWVITLAIGYGVSSNTAISEAFLPILNISAVLLPIGMFLVICLKGLPLPGARRSWSVFGASIVLGPVLATFLEMFAFIGFIVMVALYARATPGLAVALQNLLEALRNESRSMDYISKEATTLLLAPGTALALLGLFSLAVPIIEEGLKVSLLWFYAGRLRSPVEGFVLGILCGAAFALAENVGFSSSGASGEWLTNVLTRATAALPHMFNSGLMGFALVSAWQKKSYLHLGLTYLAVIAVHGTWNALSIALAFSSANTFVADLPAIIETPIPATLTWGILVIGLALGMFLANAQMRKQAARERAEIVGYNPTLLPQNSGENHGTIETTD